MPKEIAKKFFLDNFPTYRSQIRSFKKILVGFSNQIFKIVLLDGRSFKVRIAENNNLISRKNELEVLKLIEDPYLIIYDEVTGNAIYHWVEGEQLKTKNIDQTVLEKIIQLANRYHEIPKEKLTNIEEHNHFDFYCKIDKDRLEYQKYFPIYKQLIEKYKNLPKVLAHNDISLKNLICKVEENGEEDLILIDYEWAKINTIYWEYGNFSRESQLPKEKMSLLAELLNLDLSILIDFAFVATFYSWQLSFSWDRDERLEKYRSKLIIQLEKYLELKEEGIEN